MKNNDFDFIASKFEEENVKAPESLSAENIVNSFDNKNVNNIVKIRKSKRGFKAFIAAAACFAVVITSVSVGSKYIRQSVKNPAQKPNSSAQITLDGIKYFSSYDELDKALENLKPDDGGIMKNFGIIRNEFAKSADGTAADAESSNAIGAGGVKSFGKTNTQVESVDEADIIKNDGKYIYFLSQYDNNVIKIYSADKGKTELVSEIEAPSRDNSFLKEMYISDDKLIALGTYEKSSSDYEINTFVNIYDISDRKKPELIKEYAQSGDYSTSRMYDGCVYIVSNYYKFNYKKGFVPCVDYDDKEEELPIENICAIDGFRRTGYAVIGALSLDGDSTKHNTKAVLGASENVYCNEKNLYLAGMEYTDGFYSDGDEKTQIIKYTFDKTDVELKASGKVKGTVNNQFSLDEKDGNLRIATTAFNYNDGKDKNYLFVLNEKLEKIGEVTGFARDEHIEAVRYIGDTAYVITFQQTDPLFIIDLKNPKKPEITGEVKIDGFSSSLTPIDENTLLGIGYSTKVNEFGGVQTNGLKFVIFDISDKNNPKVLSEKTVLNSDSPVQENHKALCVNRDRNYFAIPYYTFNNYDEFEEYDTDVSHTAVGIIRSNNGKIEFSELDCGKEDNVARCTYIDDYLYAIYEESGEIQSFNVK